MRLRTAHLDDLAGLVALEQECFGAEAWSEASVAAEVARVPATRFALVAEDDSVLVGYAILLVVAETADVHRVAVSPDRRRSGIGRHLVAALLAEASRRGCPTALLEVAADNTAAQALYRAAGFGVIHRRRGYYGAGRDALVMSRPLRDS